MSCGQKRSFSGFPVGFCINEEKVICYQLELGNVSVREAVSAIHKRLREDETCTGRQDLSLPGIGCRATGDVPEVHLLQLWRKLL